MDYRLHLTGTLSAVCHIAIHGGSLEGGTSEIAQAVATAAGQSYYSMVSLRTRPRCPSGRGGAFAVSPFDGLLAHGGT
ncbi:poly-gamma-glutamate hydrolase family protein [Wenjunlia tyrosinilytica]|uniref:Uncharacterized protein n=1 Tax=Wenjunlia tyrosinilytica TaxID=1544741 RepID=A0A917ZEH0_9ACTN|nr:poly-gamma-glutamate hydrolase family protein [Wenjunlia tyrosinilytica]GGO80434.1 hypothetical protein GCM10012280_02340 [Wenjunlia tyrosinilytica]